jgi:hypothetical protein
MQSAGENVNKALHTSQETEQALYLILNAAQAPYSAPKELGWQ